MGTDNRARGTFNHTTLPFQEASAGRSDEYGASIPPGGRMVAYVHHGGPQDGDDEEIVKRSYTSIATALKFCREDRGDTIIALPGHAENVDAADDWADLVAGTRIIGLGEGNLRPTLTWTVATSTILLNVANVHISGFIFECAGPAGTTALSVAAPITVSAAGCSISSCLFHTQIDGNQLSTITLTTTADADDLTLSGCRFYGSGDGTTHTAINFVGADRLVMVDCEVFDYSSAAGAAPVRFDTTESLNIYMKGCSFSNKVALSEMAVEGMASNTGVVIDCFFGVLDTADLTGWDTPGDIQFSNCFVANLAGENGAVKAPLST